MKTVTVSEDYQHMSPAGAQVRLLQDNQYGGMAQCTLKANTISKAVRHKTVGEFWYVLSGSGAIWRKNEHGESVSKLESGVSIDIPLGTDFQYRSDQEDMVFICVTMPPWPGAGEWSILQKASGILQVVSSEIDFISQR